MFRHDIRNFVSSDLAAFQPSLLFFAGPVLVFQSNFNAPLGLVSMIYHPTCPITCPIQCVSLNHSQSTETDHSSQSPPCSCSNQ